MTTISSKDTLRKIESAVGDAHHLAVLMQWIECARHLIGEFETLSMNDKAFDAILKRQKIPVFNATWEAEQSDSLARLLSIQCQLLNAAHDAAEGSAL